MNGLIETEPIENQLDGKTILVVDAERDSKQYMFDVAKALGVKVILVDPRKDAHVNRNALEYIVYDYSDSALNDIHAEQIIDILNSKQIRLDGCLTFNESSIPLAAKICTMLKMIGSELEGTKIAKSKYETHRVLLNGSKTSNFAVKSVRVDNLNLESAMKEVGMPAVMKFEYGSGTFFVRLVRNVQECKKEYDNFQTKFPPTFDDYTFGFGHGRSLVLMSYVDGTEHDIDIVMYKGEMIAAFIRDSGPKRPGSFKDTAGSMPSCLPLDQQSRIFDAVYQCCIGIGLQNGVFNVGVRMTKEGPKLIEINARIAGGVSQKWILKCYGVNLLKCASEICCGIKPNLSKLNPATCHIMGLMCDTIFYKTQLDKPQTLQRLNELVEKGNMEYWMIGIGSDLQQPEDDLTIIYCILSVTGRNIKSAKQKLLKICNDLNLNDLVPSVEYLLKDFHVKI